MAKVLIVDDADGLREVLTAALFDAGYDVIGAGDGRTALKSAASDHPDVILLDITMPGMDGFEVLMKLRQDPTTEEIPVIMLTGMDAVRGERASFRLGVEHYITKPWEPGVIEAVVKAALRESGAVTTPIKSGDMLLDEKLGGGIPLGSLTLVEGASSSGKSVLCQHLAYGAVRDGHNVTYFTSESNPRALVTQMGSINLDVVGPFRSGKFSVRPLDEWSSESEETEKGLESTNALINDIRTLPRQHKLVIVDSITNLISRMNETAVMGFFTQCKKLSSGGKTVMLVAHTYAFNEQLLIRIRSLCDAHLSFRVESVGARLMKVLEVHKVHNADQLTGNVVTFDVEPGMGIRVVSIRKAQA